MKQRKTKRRRVILQRVAGKDQSGRACDFGGGNRASYLARRTVERATPYKIHPIVRLTDEGIDWGVRPASGDEVGYAMDPTRTDDCFEAAMATCTQVPIEQVPALELDARLREGADPEELSELTWKRIDQWAAKRGLEMRFWDEVPVPRSRWIGVVVVDTSSVKRFASDHTGRIFLEDAGDDPTAVFVDHCLVMAGERVHFDPMCSLKPPPGFGHQRFEADDLTYGITFDRKE